MVHKMKLAADSPSPMNASLFSLILLWGLSGAASRPVAPFVSTAGVPRCSVAPASLSKVLEALDQRERAPQQQRSLARMELRARRAAWLPQLLLSAEHRHVQDQERQVQVAAALRWDARFGDSQVFRAQMRWQLDRLLHHHGALAARRFARQVADAHQRRRQALARQHARLTFVWRQGCHQGWPPALYEEYLLLRAEIIATTALALPLPAAPQRAPNAP